MTQDERNEEIQHIEEMLSLHRKNLRRLEKQNAIHAEGEKKLAILNQIDAERETIASYEERLRILKEAAMPQSFSEDGLPIRDEHVLSPPSPRFNAIPMLTQLDAPGGAVRLRDTFYVERQADTDLKMAMVNWGTTTTVRAPRQTGRTSLLARGIHHAKQSDAKAVFIDFQELEQTLFMSSERFLRNLAVEFCRQLRMDEDLVEAAWQSSQAAQQKLTYFLEDIVLPAVDVPLTLVMDEADYLLERTTFYQDFFGLVRSWHNRRAFEPEQWEKFNIVMSISTEPYLLIEDKSQSPFNVGLRLTLDDFSAVQIDRLNQQHGSPVTAHEFADVLTWLGGHPYLVRLALYELVKKNLIWPQLVGNALADESPFSEHLRHQYALVQDKPNLLDADALKQVNQTGKCADDDARYRLTQAGLIREKHGKHTVRCQLYHRYFEEKLR